MLSPNIFPAEKPCNDLGICALYQVDFGFKELMGNNYLYLKFFKEYNMQICFSFRRFGGKFGRFFTNYKWNYYEKVQKGIKVN